jgi:hypothetical protein
VDHYKIIKRIVFNGKIKPTGKTVHYFGNNELPLPFSLEIAQYEDDNGYYLLYLDKNGEVQTDTYHDSIHAAMEQAEWEFDISEEEWEDAKTG